MNAAKRASTTPQMTRFRSAICRNSASLWLLLLSATQANAQTERKTPPRGSLTIIANERQSVLTVQELAKLPRRAMRIVAEGSSDSVAVSGVALWDVLQSVGVPSAEASGRQRAVMFLRLAGEDGQNAAVALVEVDPGFSRRPALIVDRRNDKPLDDSEGPWRVIIPDDMRHARWIRGLITIEVRIVRP